MKYTILGKNNSIVYIENEDVLITDSQSALDLMMTVIYEKECTRIILDKKTIIEEFFRLSSGIAGDVLQKFTNYRTKLAIVGDFSNYTSKPLHDFIYECNKGNDIFFVDNLNQAIEKLDVNVNIKMLKSSNMKMHNCLIVICFLVGSFHIHLLFYKMAQLF